MTGGLALSPLMRELLSLLDTDWKTINEHAYPRRTARALKNRGLVQTTDPLQSRHTYQARLTASGVREHQRLVDEAHHQPELELDPTWVGNLPPGF